MVSRPGLEAGGDTSAYAGVADAPAVRKPKAGAKASRLWWFVHHWAGLKLSLFSAFVMLTGTLAVLSNEIDWLLNPAQRAAVAGPVVHDWPAMAAGATSALRPGERILSLEAPVDRGFSARAMVTRAGGGEDEGPPPRWVYVHPATGEVLGEGSWLTAQRILRNAHRHLFLPVKIGVPIVSIVAVLLLVSLVSAFVVYKKWWRGFFRPMRWRDARTAWGDLHRLAGLWGLWFVALMAVTGLWYLVEVLGGAAPGLPRTRVAASGTDPATVVATFPRAHAAMVAVHPDLRVQRVMFPTETSGAFQFHGDHEAILVRPRANAVWVEAATGAVVLVTDGRDLNVHQRISEAADPLHFGTWGGVWSKVVWFVAGLGLTGLCVSGAAIYSGRLLGRARPHGIGAHVGAIWRGMGVWAWPSLAGVLVCLGLAAGFVVRVV